jgi:hypothetical protein
MSQCPGKGTQWLRLFYKRICKTCEKPFAIRAMKLHDKSHDHRGWYCSPGCRAKKQPFWDYVLKGDGCWLWLGATNEAGYGLYHKQRAHRVAYELTYGPIPSGMLACHSCDNPPCVRPDHLFPGTTKENVHDALKKNRPFGCKKTRHGERWGSMKGD